MALRWAAAAALETEKGFRKIMGHRDLWMLKAVVDEGQSAGKQSLVPIDKGRLAAQNNGESRPGPYTKSGA
jgi:hypothetical protein